MDKPLTDPALSDIHELAVDSIDALCYMVGTEKLPEIFRDRIARAVGFPPEPFPMSQQLENQLAALRLIKHVEDVCYLRTVRLVKQLRWRSVPWREIGEQLGITRSAAQQRFDYLADNFGEVQVTDADA